ncbi:hypothetical protein CPB86DRAFT_721580 [Serendipita vermifera]|nr:hypothetical protein CPB86DRAFT_721580 [Serendipita vermifera]
MSRRRSGSAIRARTDSNASSSSISGPPSPTFSATTNASQVQLDAGPDTIITRRDLRQSLNAYEDLVVDCEAYRSALLAMSSASSRFAATFERCSRLKGVEDSAAIGLQAAGGLHHLIANHWQVLSMTLRSGFEEPLRAELEHYKKVVSERSSAYEKTLLEKSKIIKQTEAESINTGRRKQRDLQTFRKTLATLQNHVDDLDRLKAAHYQQILEHEVDVWNRVLDKTSFTIRSTLDVFERISAKASDPMLEPLMQSVLDPFDAYGPVKSDNQIFSILPPLAILSNTRTTFGGPSPSPPVLNGHGAKVGGIMSTSMYETPSTTNYITPQTWASGSADWSNLGTNSPSSSNSSPEKLSDPNLPYRRPSSPPSTSTLRITESKSRPSIVEVENVLSSGTIKGAEASTRKDSGRRDTILAPRPPKPEPEDGDLQDNTLRIPPPTPEKQEAESPLPTPKRAGFASSFSKLISSSSSSSSGGEKGH